MKELVLLLSPEFRHFENPNLSAFEACVHTAIDTFSPLVREGRLYIDQQGVMYKHMLEHQFGLGGMSPNYPPPSKDRLNQLSKELIEKVALYPEMHRFALTLAAKFLRESRPLPQPLEEFTIRFLIDPRIPKQAGRKPYEMWERDRVIVGFIDRCELYMRGSRELKATRSLASPEHSIIDAVIKAFEHCGYHSLNYDAVHKLRANWKSKNREQPFRILNDCAQTGPVMLPPWR